MKTKQDQKQLLPAAFAGLILATVPLHGEIVFSYDLFGPVYPSSTTDEVAFELDVSTTDLLHGNAGTGDNWMNSGWGDSGAGLTDGSAGGDFDRDWLPALAGTAWALEGDNASSREFVLGTGTYGLGFDITGIQSIAAWQGAGYPNQHYTVSVSYVGNDDFITLTTVEYQPFVGPFPPNEVGGSTKVNVTEDETGVLASGVDAIRFDTLAIVGVAGGGAVYREIDVFGGATVPEASAAALLGLGGLALLRRRRAS